MSNKKPDYEGIEKELKDIGAKFEEEKGTISITFPNGTRKALIPPKKKRPFTIKEWSDMHYFQRGTLIVFPARYGYRITGISGYRVILSPK